MRVEVASGCQENNCSKNQHHKIRRRTRVAFHIRGFVLDLKSHSLILPILQSYFNRQSFSNISRSVECRRNSDLGRFGKNTEGQIEQKGIVTLIVEENPVAVPSAHSILSLIPRLSCDLLPVYQNPSVQRLISGKENLKVKI